MMDALKAEAQKIAKEIEEFSSRTAKEVAALVTTISSLEDDNDKMAKRVTWIDAEAEALAKEKEELKLALIENEERLKRFSQKKREMEEMIDHEMRKLMDRDAEVKEILRRMSNSGQPEQETTQGENKMVEFLRGVIEKKEEDLTCPVCLEIAKPPIFTYPESHLICTACGPNKVQMCPQCRVRLPTPLKRQVL